MKPASRNPIRNSSPITVDVRPRSATSSSEILHTAQSQYHDIGIATKLGYATCWIERRQGMKGFGATPVPEAVTTPTWKFATLAALADAVDDEVRAAA